MNTDGRDSVRSTVASSRRRRRRWLAVIGLAVLLLVSLALFGFGVRQLVHLGRPPLPAQLRAQVPRELVEILTVGAHGMGRGVALAVEVAEEGGDLRLHVRPAWRRGAA